MAKAKPEKKKVKFVFDEDVKTATHVFAAKHEYVQILTEADIDWLKEKGAKVTAVK